MKLLQKTSKSIFYSPGTSLQRWHGALMPQSNLCFTSRFSCQQPASYSWWTFVRSAVSSCSHSFIPPTVWASEPLLTCTPARSFSARPMRTLVRKRIYEVCAITLHASLSLLAACNLVFLCISEQHFSEVVQGEEFLGLSLQQVSSLISSDQLTVSTEEKVWSYWFSTLWFQSLWFMVWKYKAGHTLIFCVCPFWPDSPVVQEYFKHCAVYRR